jgi:urease alpha subunit
MPDKAQQQQENRLRAEISAAINDLHFFAIHSSDLYAARRIKELVNATSGGRDELKKHATQLRHDFDYMVIATGNATAVRRRDSLQQLLDTL